MKPWRYTRLQWQIVTKAHALLRWGVRILCGITLFVMAAVAILALSAEMQYDRSEVFWGDFAYGVAFVAGMLAFSEFMLWGIGLAVFDERLRPLDTDENQF